MASVTDGHHVPEPSPMTKAWDLTPPELVRNGLRRLQSTGQAYGVTLIILAVLTVIGIIALIVRSVANGWSDRQAWTYVAVAFGYLMSTVAAAPCVCVAARLTRSHWRRAIDRISEIWAAAMIVPVILFLLLMATVPGTRGRPTIWFGWWAAPYLWDGILVVGLAFTGYALLYISSIPDLAIARAQIADGKANWLTRRAEGFFGTETQWRIIERSVSYLGAFYAVMYIGTMTVIASDFIMSLIPGYSSAIFPAYFVVSGFGGGIALVVVTASILRIFGGAEDYLGREQFFALGKMQLAFGLLWAYFIWTDFVIPWYGRQPWEILQIKLLYFKSYVWLFVVAFALCFISPLFLMMWTKLRRSRVGPFIVSSGVLIGLLADRIRLFSAAFSDKDITQDHLHALPPVYTPGVLDILILIGAIAAVIAIVMLACRMIPVPSIWDMTEGTRLRVKGRYHNVEVMIIGKTDY
ncbi:MAG TPA: hypothetical protein VHV31_13980 [Nitrolancea sp.]|jgi:hypothetical protein|nr:hypothetical protein [Nitrolancea sp.]